MDDTDCFNTWRDWVTTTNTTGRTKLQRAGLQMNNTLQHGKYSSGKSWSPAWAHEAAVTPLLCRMRVSKAQRQALGLCWAGRPWPGHGLAAGDTEQCPWKGAEQLAALLPAWCREAAGQLVMGSSGRSCWGSASVRDTHYQTCPGGIKAEHPSYSLRFAHRAAFNCHVSFKAVPWKLRWGSGSGGCCSVVAEHSPAVWPFNSPEGCCQSVQLRSRKRMKWLYENPLKNRNHHLARPWAWGLECAASQKQLCSGLYQRGSSLSINVFSLWSVSQEARWMQLNEERVNFHVPMCLPVWHGVSCPWLGSPVCCCRAGHSTLVGTKPWRAAHRAHLWSIKPRPELVPRALWLCCDSDQCQPGHAAPWGCCGWWQSGWWHTGPQTLQAGPSCLLSSLWAGSSRNDFLWILHGTSCGLSGASVFSLATLARAVLLPDCPHCFPLSPLM